MDDESESSESLPATVTAAPGPPVMMTTASAPPVVVTAPAAAHASVAMPVAALDLDQGFVDSRRGRHAQSGGSGYGHGQRSKQRSRNQNETSHLVLSRRVIAIWHKFPTNGFVPAGSKLIPDAISWHQLPFIPDLFDAVAHHTAGSAMRNPSARGLGSSWQETGKSGNIRYDRCAGERNG
jgi:hypothetical protein